LYNPQKVKVSLDNTLLPHQFKSISPYITLIPQEPELFNSTIKHNITVGVSHSDKNVIKHCELARFAEVVNRLPKGLKSVINEKGVNLSGGEKQRLALARGLLACHGKPIILLDEPTSSVDGKNERAIYNNIFQEFPEATLVSSIHRLHLLELFDTIIMFDKGKIVANGTLAVLLRTSAQFKAYWKKYHGRQ